MPSWVLLRMTAGAALLISMCGSALAAAPSQIRGVLRGQGTKSADITVVLVPSTNDGGSARTVKPDDDGGFRFPMVEYGRYRLALEGGRSRIAKLRLQVRNEGRIEEDREVAGEADGRSQEFVVAPGRIVQLEVFLADSDVSSPFTEARRLWSEKRYVESNLALDRLGAEADANATYLRGLNALGLVREEEAESQFRKAVEMDPAMAGVRAQLAALLHKRGDKAAAAELLAKELELDPGNKEVATNYAIVLTDTGDARAAVRAWRRVLELTPENALAGQELARLLTDLGEVAEAKRVLEQVEAVGRPDPAFWFNIGANLSNQDKFEEAESAYRKALTLDPAFPPAHRELGYLVLRKGDTAAASEHLRAYLDAAAGAPDAAEVRDLLKSLEAPEKK